MSNTILVPNDIWDDPQFKDEPFTRREAWLWLISKINPASNKHRVGSEIIHLERGELAASVCQMAKAWQWDKAKVRGFLKNLQDHGKLKFGKGE